MLIRNKIAIVVVGLGIGVASAYQIGTSDAMVSRLLAAQIAQVVRAPCRFESASFTFLHGLDVRGLEILDPTAPLGPALVTAAEARVDYALGLFGMGPRITRVDVIAPRLRFERRSDGTLPIGVAFTTPPAGGASPRPFLVSSRQGEATFVDPTVLAGDPLALRDISIDVTPRPFSADWTGAGVTLSATSEVLGPVTANAVLGAGVGPDAVTLDLPRLRIDPALPRRFVGDLARTIAEMVPSGEAAAHVELRFEKDKVFAKEATVELRGVAVRVALPTQPAGSAVPKPFDVTQASGRLRFAADRLEAKDIAFRALGAEFHAEGTIDGVTKSERVLDTKVEIRRLPATREFREFLPYSARRVADALDLVATVDATAAVRGPAGAPTIAVDATFDHGHVSYVGYVQANGLRDGFPWDGDDVSGKAAFVDDVLHIDAAGRHGPASIRVNGTVTMRPGEPDVSEILIRVKDVPLDDDVRRAFGDERAAKSFDPFKPSGTAAQVTVHVFRDVAVDEHDVAEVAIDFDGRADFLPDVLPEPLHRVSGKVEVLYPVTNGRREELVVLTGMRAAADGFDLRLDGRFQGVMEDIRFDADVAEAGAGFRRAIETSPKISSGTKSAARNLGATGPLAASAHIATSAEGVATKHVTFTLKGTSVQGWGDIPLAARGLTGHVEVAGDVVTFEEVAGEFLMDPFFPRFTGHGTLSEIEAKPQPLIHVDAVDLPLAEPLRAALGPLAETARAFWDHARPVGARADCALDFRPDADATPFEVTISRIRGGFRPLGLELDADAGTCRYDGRHVQVSGLDAAIGAASLRFGEADFDVETGDIDIHVGARGLRFPEDLEGPLSRETIDKIVEFAPGRTLHAPDVRLAYERDKSQLTIRGPISLRPRKGRPPVDLGYAPEGGLDLEPLVLSMPENGDVGFHGVARAEDFAIRVGLAVDKFNGPIDSFSGTFGTPSTFEMTSKDASFRVIEYPIEHADTTVKLSGDGTRVEVTAAKFMNGDFHGVVKSGPQRTGYRGDIHIANADLERFLRLRGDPRREVATGKVDSNVDFHNATGARADLRGDGKITVREGRLMPAPGLGAVLLRVATAGIYAPSLTDAVMKFDLDGDSILVTKLEVGDSQAAAITDGKGRVGFDGTLDVSVDGPLVSVPVPVVGPIVELFFKPWPTSVRVTGTLRNPRTQWVGYSFQHTAASGRPEPQPADEERPPEHDPW